MPRESLPEQYYDSNYSLEKFMATCLLFLGSLYKPNPLSYGVEETSKEGSSREDQARCQPVLRGEGVLKIEYREEEAEEFSECDY